jgi:hypothetical protein
MYLASLSTHANHDAQLINLSASFHTIPHKEWFCEYENYDGGDVILGDDSTTNIIGLLVVEPDYLPDSEVCFSRAWTPFPNGGVWGGFPPHNCRQGGPGGGGGDNFCSPPWRGIRGQCPRSEILGKISL